MKQKSRLALFLLLGFLVITLNFIPDLVSDELKGWCLEKFGPKYPWYFIGFFVVASFVLLWLGDLKELLGTQSQSVDPESLNIPWSLEATQRLENANKAIAKADHQTALRLLYEFDAPALKMPLTLLSSQLAKLQDETIAGTQAADEKSVAFNKVTKGIVSLIHSIETSFADKEAENRKIRASLRQRYQERLNQKIAFRQAVKLRTWLSKKGTSELVASTFKTYPETEIPEEISNFFLDARGRLLIVGQPGMGKTTLLLELADRLFDLEPDALPILINLASWKSGFIQLETWLEEVLASELSTNKSGAKAVLQQSNLILLLDGLDELKEESEMASCLAAIAEYGKTAGRRFVITCRMEEYKTVQEDARVNMQIEVGSLNAEELIAELEKTGYEQPEAKVLAEALRKDELLRQVVETPFYFNTLQLMYAGRTPAFTTNDPESRKSEIEQKFVEYTLNNNPLSNYTATNAGHWLSFLAKRMTDKSKVVFELLDLQYDWQKGTRGEKIAAGLVGGLVEGLVIGLVEGLVIGLVIGLFEGLFEGLFVGLAIGLAIGLVGGLVGGIRQVWALVVTKDTIVWSINNLIKYIKKNLVWSLVGGLVIGLVFSLVGGLVFDLFEGLVEGLVVGLVVGLVMSLVMSLVGGLVDMIDYESATFTQINKPYQRFYASMRQLYFSILQHWHLRYLLYKKGLLPWHLVDFLNEMKSRHILESNGATWRFRHRILQEYFAKKWKEERGSNAE